MFKVNRLPFKGRAAIVFAISYLLATDSLLAQQRIAAVDSKTAAAASETGAGKNAPSKSEPSLEEMLTTIRRLEERVRELEAKAKPTATQAAESANPAATISAPTAVATPVKLEAPAAQDKAEEDKANNGILGFFRSTEVTGFVDTYYGYNFNSPPIDTQLRNFDTRHNQFSFNLAEIALEKKPTPDSRWDSERT